ncbi:MAG: hypothetical protein AAGA60_08975 [Cyanobacteria bacterium P01_E01_bin.42]
MSNEKVQANTEGQLNEAELDAVAGGGTYSDSGSFTDPTGDTVNYEYSVSDDGSVSGSASGNKGSVSASYDSSTGDVTFDVDPNV